MRVLIPMKTEITRFGNTKWKFLHWFDSMLTAVMPIRTIRAIRSVCIFNPLKTKRRVLYLKTQSVPRCKHFSSRL